MPRVRTIHRLSLTVLLLAAFGSVAWAKPKVAILGLEVSNSGAGVVDKKDADTAVALTNELRTYARGGAGKFEMAPNSNRELQDEKLMANCDTEKPSCMAPIGSGLQADYLMYGRIERTTDKGKDGYRIAIKLLNVKAKPPVVDENWDGFLDQSKLGSGALKEWSMKVHAKLSGEKLPPDRVVVDKGPGKLVVKVGNVRTGVVFVDGAKKGELDDGALTVSLPDGPHLLAIESTDHKRFEETVTITSGQTKAVDVELETMVGPIVGPGRSGSPTWRKVMWTSVVVGLGAGTVWAVAWRKKNSAADELCGASDCGKEHPRLPGLTDERAVELSDEAEKWSRVTIAMGGVVAAASVLTIVGAWRGYFTKSGGSEARTSSGERGKRTRRDLVVTPVLAPNGGGATLRFDW